MLFNSVDFAVFIVIVFFSYWVIFSKHLKSQNIFILVVSYIFYGWWDWRYLLLLFMSSLVDYVIGLWLGELKDSRRRKLLLYASLAFNLCLLGFFKYFNFFVDSFISSFNFLGASLHKSTLDIILPIGISFYTLQTLSYTIDIYRKRIEPTKDAIAYFAYVSFFPQLVAGPIEKARNLIPQLEQRRLFNYEMVRDGLKYILWGLFMKIVVADRLAPLVDTIFENHQSLSSVTLLIGMIYFSCQIYCDFAGYSYIAIGIAKLLGINLSKNFEYPYFQPSFRKFWQKWHITLMSWMRDYLYSPLVNSLDNNWKKIICINIVFLVCGLWHGANWSFVIWGGINGIYMSVSMFMRDKKLPMPEKIFPEKVNILLTFTLFLFAATFFRAGSLEVALSYLRQFFDFSLFDPTRYSAHMALVIAFFSWEWVKRDKAHPLIFNNANTLARWSIYGVLIILIVKSFSNPKTYIYYQF